jgi:hypothetical protein
MANYVDNAMRSTYSGDYEFVGTMAYTDSGVGPDGKVWYYDRVAPASEMFSIYTMILDYAEEDVIVVDSWGIFWNLTGIRRDKYNLTPEVINDWIKFNRFDPAADAATGRAADSGVGMKLLESPEYYTDPTTHVKTLVRKGQVTCVVKCYSIYAMANDKLSGLPAEEKTEKYNDLIEFIGDVAKYPTKISDEGLVKQKEMIEYWQNVIDNGSAQDLEDLAETEDEFNDHSLVKDRLQKDITRYQQALSLHYNSSDNAATYAIDAIKSAYVNYVVYKNLNDGAVGLTWGLVNVWYSPESETRMLKQVHLGKATGGYPIGIFSIVRTGGIFNSIFHSETWSFTTEDATAISAYAQLWINMLPADLDPNRRKVVEAACSLVGKVQYFYGGKYNKVGWNPVWGQLHIVSSDSPGGGWKIGQWRPYGLDCSGFVTWVFINANESETNSLGNVVGNLIGHGTTGQAAQGTLIYDYTNPSAYNFSDVQIGDIILYPETNAHVGIIIGFDINGNIVVCHENDGAHNVSISGRQGFLYVYRPRYDDIFR